jgi:hypothetical protein
MTETVPGRAAMALPSDGHARTARCHGLVRGAVGGHAVHRGG